VSGISPPWYSALGGGGGGFFEKVYLLGQISAGDSISYAIGAGGAGGINTWNGGDGDDGAIIIDWDF
jgi:hypothetical protein